MNIKDIIPFLEENKNIFKVHCGRGSTDTFFKLYPVDWTPVF